MKQTAGCHRMRQREREIHRKIHNKPIYTHTNQISIDYQLSWRA